MARYTISFWAKTPYLVSYQDWGFLEPESRGVVLCYGFYGIDMGLVTNVLSLSNDRVQMVKISFFLLL